MTSPLECRNLSMSYGGVRALSDVSCTFPAGTVTGVVGMNGAGKTTLMSVIAQHVRGARGEVLLYGRDIMGIKDFRAVRLGVAKTYQNIQLFSGMSVRQNLAVGQAGQHLLAVTAADVRRRGVARSGAGEELVERAADIVGLTRQLDLEVATLSYGHRKKVELARALVTSPRVLLLDEPSSGLSQAEVYELEVVIQRLRTLVDALVVVEHNFGLLFHTADRVLVLERGHQRFDGPIGSFSQPDQLRELFGI
jgi:branched-chain amino acid transport system ATP-binding protein